MKLYKDHLVPINNVCNQKCVFCSAEYRMQWNKPIPLKDIFKQILEKWDYIQISWWEPLLNPDLYKILFFIKQQKPQAFIEFQTNGVFLLKKNNLDKLQKFHINLYNVNYPCHIEEVNNKIAGLSWTLEPREAAMREIIRRGLHLRVNIIINTLNYPYLSRMVRYIYENFSWLERIQFSFTKAMWAADKNDEVVPRYEEVENFLVSALEECANCNIRVDVDHIPMCFLWKYFDKHVDFHKMKSWEKWVWLEEKNYVNRCITCDKRDFCSWYRKDYLEIYPS